jgi:o-succinylbenzoate synthase
MKIKTLSLQPYEIPMTSGQTRRGLLLQILDEKGNRGLGETAPLPRWSVETLEEAEKEIEQRKEEICCLEWTKENSLQQIKDLSLLPSVTFGLESALLSLLDPVSSCDIATSALLMGSLEEILQQAALRKKEGYKVAKLKVSSLSFKEAKDVIYQLKDLFRLRIDVNRAWKTKDSLSFFEEFPLDAFDYVEEPFQDPKDLTLFSHPLAVDESFPGDLSLEDLERIPALKALIYKPTMQGGMASCIPLVEWARKRGVDVVLSSSFEIDVGLSSIAALAQRLSLKAPIGIGTIHFLKNHLGGEDLLNNLRTGCGVF